ncbi:hypothetical protein [Methylosinus sporium]|nr:hypothetical protein [Methylosinus sporium]
MPGASRRPLGQFCGKSARRRTVEKHDFLPRQYFLVYQKRD